MTHEVPDGWTVTNVSSVCSVVTGKTPSTKNPDFWDGDIPFVTPSDIDDRKYVPSTLRSITNLGAEKSKIIPKNSVAVTCIASVGKNAIIKEPSVTNQQINILIPTDKVDFQLLYYLMEHNAGTLRGMAGTTAVPIVNKTLLSELPLLLPPLPEQKKIAEVLSSVDEAIAATKAVIDQTKQVKKGLLQTLLTKGIGHTKFKQTELGEIPESWEILKLSDSGISVIDGDRGKAYPKAADFTDEGYCLFLSAKNITKDGFRWVNNQFIGEERHGLLRKGALSREDIVLTTRGTVGNIGYYDHSVPYDVVRINSGMVILRNNGNCLSTGFLYLLLNSPIVHQQIDQLAFGSAQPQLTVKVIKDFLLPVPPLAEQPDLAALLQNCFETLTANEESLAELENLKSGLMSDLLTGRT